jgi:hypothetical protein
MSKLQALTNTHTHQIGWIIGVSGNKISMADATEIFLY